MYLLSLYLPTIADAKCGSHITTPMITFVVHWLGLSFFGPSRVRAPAQRIGPSGVRAPAQRSDH